MFSFPAVDSGMMVWPDGLTAPLIASEPDVLSLEQMSDAAPPPEPHPDVSFAARFSLTAEPRVDDHAFGQRLKAEVLGDDGFGPWPLGFSILWHTVIVTMIFGFVQFAEVKNSFEENLNEPIEVNFGMSLDAGRALPDGKTADHLSEAEATKSLQQLPQLPKLLAVDAATPPPAENALAFPQAGPPAPSPTLAPAATASPKPVEKVTPGPVVQQVDPSAAKKMKLEELAKRLEKEQRTVGAKDKAGVKNGPQLDSFKRPMDIPISPLGKDIPKAPSVLGQSGMLSGKVSAQVKSQYAQAAALHMKKFWSLPDVLMFEAKLEVVLGFEINSAGRIMGRVKVVRGSGNARFDEEAMRALESAGPFPDLPREMGTKLSLRMKFSPQSINF
ncbi:MAG: hypothetical protein RIR26_79 [Pseudomonadota bacterium]